MRTAALTSARKTRILCGPVMQFRAGRLLTACFDCLMPLDSAPVQVFFLSALYFLSPPLNHLSRVVLLTRITVYRPNSRR